MAKQDNKNNVVYVFIDASNVWDAQKAKGRMFDFEKLRKYLKEEYNANDIEIFYYTAYPADGTRDYSLEKKHKFFTYLKKGLGIIWNQNSLNVVPYSQLCVDARVLVPGISSSTGRNSEPNSI